MATWKYPIDIATTRDLPLLAIPADGQIDGITVADGMRVLVKNQVVGSENGYYTVTGAPLKLSAFEQPEPDDVVRVHIGQRNALSTWEFLGDASKLFVRQDIDRHVDSYTLDSVLSLKAFRHAQPGARTSVAAYYPPDATKSYDANNRGGGDFVFSGTPESARVTTATPVQLSVTAIDQHGVVSVPGLTLGAAGNLTTVHIAGVNPPGFRAHPVICLQPVARSRSNSSRLRTRLVVDGRVDASAGTR